MDGSLHILDVQEKEVGAVRAPSFPTRGSTGFPQPRKRSQFASTIRQQGQKPTATAAAAAAALATSVSASGEPTPCAPTLSSVAHPDKATIDQENRNLLGSMGAGEIAEARQELLSNLDPSLLQILFRRAHLDDGSNTQLPGEASASARATQVPAIHIEEPTTSMTSMTLTTMTKPEPTLAEDNDRACPAPADPVAEAGRSAPRSSKSVRFATVEDVVDDDEQAHALEDPLLVPVRLDNMAPLAAPEKAISNDHGHDHEHNHDHTSSRMHFPQGPTVPDLDPGDPDFLQNLHAKYFPNLPADPARLAWMAPLPTADSPADRESPYYPGQDSVAVSQLRFDFRGRLLSPRASRTIPVSKGLHHHGVAPEAAGYTVGELARLARSAVPAQRCVAFQALGRILYRLGRGDWGTNMTVEEDKADDGLGDELAQGIWRSMCEGRVLETLQEAAGVDEMRGHRGSRAYAIEAIWLFEKGGWKARWKGR